MSPKMEKVSDGLFLNKENGIYYVRKTFRKDRIPDLFKSTGCKTKGKAKSKSQAIIDQHRERYLSGDFDKRNGKRTSEVIDEILKIEKPKKRKRTQRKYDDMFGELGKAWGHWDINRINLVAWSDWLERFKERKKNRKSFDDYVKFMNILMRYAYSQRYTSHLTTFPCVDEKKESVGRVFTEKEIALLWEHMNEETRDQFTLSFECFMRLREVLLLSWDRVNLKTGVITLRAQDVKTGSRTGRGRSLEISEHALKRLKERRKHIDSPHVFPSPTDPSKPVFDNKTAWQATKRRAQEAENKKAEKENRKPITIEGRWHDLRHTALTKALLEQRLDPILVSEYAGVSLRTIQRVYLHATHEKTRSVAGSIKVL